MIRYTPTGLRSVDVEKRTAEFVISDATVDRHGTVLDSNWDLTNYNRNGIVGYQHEVYGSFFSKSDPDSIIGKSTAEWVGNELIGKMEFEPKELNPLAEKIFQKVIFGTLKATSVGFMPTEEGETKTIKEGEKEKKIFHFGKRELLEWSIVNIPSNPNALVRKFVSSEDAEMKKYFEDNKINLITFEPTRKLYPCIQDLRTRRLELLTKT